MITPAEALKNLDSIAARVALSRDDHTALQESTAVLATLIAADEKRRAVEAEASKP